MYRHVTRTRQSKEPASAGSGPWAVWADALFASSLQRSDNPSTGQIRQAIAAAVYAFGGPGIRRPPGDGGHAHALGSCGGQRGVRLGAGANAKRSPKTVWLPR